MTAPARTRVARLLTHRRIPALVVAVLAVLGLVLPGLAVTAAVTAGSTIVGNRFGAADRVDVGVHALEVVPASGRSTFRPGDTATVSFRMTPVGRPTVVADLRAGDTLRFSVTLPSWLVPGTLPAPGTFANGSTSWTKELDPDSGAWTVTRTSSFTGPQSSFTATNPASFPVVAQGVVTTGDVVATVAVPERLGSTSPSGTVAVSGISHVAVGVYDLAVAPTDAQRFAEGTAGTVSFLATPAPSSAWSPTHFRTDEQLVHELTLPSWLRPAALPVYLPTSRSHTVWASGQNPDGTWFVRRTQTFYEDWTTFSTVDLGFGVVATGTPVEGDTIRAAVTLPGGLTSQNGTDEVDAMAAQRAAVGVYDLNVAPAAGAAFLPEMRGTVDFSTTPGATTVPVRLDAGDTVTHVLTVPSWLAVDLPSDADGVSWTSAPGAGDTTVLTRTASVTTERTEYVGEVVHLPVRAKRTGLGQGTVSALATLPSHSASASRTLSLPVASTNSTAVGVHELAVSPTEGDRFSPGTTGAVTFRIIPGYTAPFTAVAGDTLVHTFVLPIGLTPRGLYAPSESAWSETEWAASESGGVWTVTRTERFLREVDDHVYRTNPVLSIGVTAGATLTDGAVVRASVAVPGHLTSSAPALNAEVVAVRTVPVGVHQMSVTPSAGSTFLPGMGGTLRFDTTPGSANVPVALAGDDTITHTVTLPPWLTPDPAPTSSGDVAWTSVAGPDGSTVLTRTQSFADGQTSYTGSTVSVPLRASRADVSPSPAAVTVAVTLPEPFGSSEASATALPTSTTQTAVGVHDLSVAPTTGVLFQTGTSGRLQFRVAPDATTPFTAVSDDTLVHDITLPAGLFPGRLPSTVEGDASTVSWGSVQDGEVWTLTRTEEFHRDVTGDVYPSAATVSVPVLSNGTLADGAVVRVTTTPPAHLTSAAATAEAPVGAVSRTTVGVHGLTVAPAAGTWFQPSAPGTVSFRVTPSGAAAAARIGVGDSVTHALTLPSWLSVSGPLPGPADTGYSTVVWSQTPAGTGRIIRTETFDEARESYPAAEPVQLPVVKSSATTAAQADVGVTATVPAHLESEATTATARVTASVETLVGVHALTVTPTGTSRFAPGTTGTVSFLTTPSASTPVAFTAAAGRQLVHTVTLPHWLRTQTLPSEQGAVWSQDTVNGNQVRVTRTVTLGATSTYTTPRLEFPVEVTPTGVPSSSSTVTATATVPSPLTTVRSAGQFTVSGTSVVHDGVYHLTAAPTAGTRFRAGVAGLVSFRAAQSTPSPVSLEYQINDTRTHVFTLPGELRPETPGDVNNSTSTIVWTQLQNYLTGSWTVTRTETFKAPVRYTSNPVISLPVRAIDALTDVNRSVVVTATLPRGLTTANGSATATASMTSENVQIGVFNAVVDCSAPGASVKSGGCRYRWNTTPNGAPIAVDLRQGDTLEFGMAGSGAAVFRYPGALSEMVVAETADYRVKLHLTSGPGFSAEGVAQTITILRDITSFQVPPSSIEVYANPIFGGGTVHGSACWAVPAVWASERVGVTFHRIGDPFRGITRALPATLCEQY
jgi:hypothetical protein